MNIICLHSFWRTSSTYFWSKLRGVPGVVAYYEPFHESLNRLAPQLPPQAGSKNWQSGHPEVVDYWSEYREMQVNTGQLGQDELGTFNKNEYFELSRGKEIQITYLIDRALELGRTTIFLCFTRSLGSSTSIRRILEDRYPQASHTHVLFKRDPREQVSANIRLLTTGQLVFVAYYIIGLSYKYAHLESLMGIELQPLRDLSFADAFGIVRAALLKSIAEKKHIAVANVAIKTFLACTMLQLANESNHFDFITDVGDLSSVRAYRDKLYSLTGVRIDTDDYNLKPINVVIPKEQFAKGLAHIRRSLQDLDLPIKSEVFSEYYQHYLS